MISLLWSVNVLKLKYLPIKVKRARALFPILPTARGRAPRAVLCVDWHFAQKSTPNFIDYYLLTNPDRYDII